MQIPVSIVLTTHNRDSLEQAFKSCANQVYGNFEIVLVSDGGGSVEKLFYANLDEEQKKKVMQLKNIVIPPAHNPGLLRNCGIAYAEGKYICFCPDDGELNPMFLELMMSKTNEDNVHDDLVVCGTREIQETGEETVHQYTELNPTFQALFRHQAVPYLFSGSFVVRKTYVEEHPWTLNPMNPCPTRTLMSSLMRYPLRTRVIDDVLYTHYNSPDMLRNRAGQAVDAALNLAP